MLWHEADQNDTTVDIKDHARVQNNEFKVNATVFKKSVEDQVATVNAKVKDSVENYVAAVNAKVENLVDSVDNHVADVNAKVDKLIELMLQEKGFGSTTPKV